jgi:hypothetical protein
MWAKLNLKRIFTSLGRKKPRCAYLGDIFLDESGAGRRNLINLHRTTYTRRRGWKGVRSWGILGLISGVRRLLPTGQSRLSCALQDHRHFLHSLEFGNSFIAFGAFCY